MEKLLQSILEPWPWYVAGPLIGLTVPALLLAGNKYFGISSSLRHVCAICFPARIPFFQYDWRKEAWNLFLVSGIVIGSFIAWFFLSSQQPIIVADELKTELANYGIASYNKQYPEELFNISELLTVRGFLLIVVGGFLVGFGTRYAGGCTSGHSITGISMLQVPSMIATVCFMLGGILVANFVLPFIMRL